MNFQTKTLSYIEPFPRTRAVTIYQYVAVLQYDVVQYNSIHLLRHINILRRAIYCSALCELCEPELDHWNVNVDKLIFLYENLRQLIFLTLAEHTLTLPVTGSVITTSVLQYSNIL